ncbi:MAG: ComEC/Rec2 family competence protein [Leifsonia sp.]
MSIDRRIVLPAIAAWVAGWAAVGRPDWAAGAAAGLGVVASTALAAILMPRHRMPHHAAVALLALCLATAALVCAAVAAAVPLRMPPALVLAAEEHSTISVDAVITTAPVLRQAVRGPTGQLRFEVRITALRVHGDEAVPGLGAPALVFAEGSENPPAVGQTVMLHGSVRGTDDGDGLAWLFFADAPARIRGPAPAVLAWAEPLRSAFRDAAARLPGDGGALLPGLAIGDTSAVAADLDSAMKHASLSHLTAVSGANCAVVVAGIMLLGAAVGLPRVARTVVAVVALAGFVVLVTPGPSVLRAAVMAGIVLFSIGLGRPGRGLSALAVAVTILLVVDPWLSRSYGLALSVAATAGLLVLAGPLALRLARWMPLPVAVAIAVPLSAQLCCQPILVLLDPTLPVGGVAANLLAEPAAPIATVIGLVGCLLMGVLPGVGVLCLRIAWLPAAWIAQVARTVDGLTVLRLPWVGGALGTVLTTAVAGIALWLLLRRPHGARRRTVAMLGAALLAVTGGYGGSLVATTVIRTVSMPADWRYAACDIGQGDAVIVRDSGRYALIDVGPDPVPLEACLDVLGIHRIDLLVLTHYDLDHVGGIDAVIGRVDEAVVGLPADAADARILARLQSGGASVRRGTAGLAGRLGGLAWSVLWPTADATLPTGNDGSVTLLVTGGGSSAIFLGDLGEEAQDAMLSAASPARVTVVKVAHHGSADQSERLYERLRAVVGLISVGVDNGYGHPTARLLGILARSRTTPLRTDLQGLILVAPGDDGSARVWTERALG